MAKRKYVYTFGNKQAEGNAGMKDLLGGKGANLAEMNLIGVPVPPGMTITTEVCTQYYKIGKEKALEMILPEVQDGVKYLEKIMGANSAIPIIRCCFLSVPVPGLRCRA